MWQDVKDFIRVTFWWSLILGFISGFIIYKYCFTSTFDKIMEDAYTQNYKFIDKRLQDHYKSWLNHKLEEKK